MLSLSSTHLCYTLFIMLRPPPSSTLFPYTTLFRSSRLYTRRFSRTVRHNSRDGAGQTEGFVQEMALFVDLIQKIRRGLDVEPLPVTQHHKCKIPGSNSGRAEKLIKILYLFPVHTDNLIPCLDPDPVCQ